MPFFFFRFPSPVVYGNFFNYLYAVWLNSFLAAFICLKLFSLASRVKIPWWLYVLATLTFPNYLGFTLGGQIITLVVFTILIYLFADHRQASFSTTIATFLFSTNFFYYLMAIISPVVLMLLSAVFPMYSTNIKNYGGNVMMLIEFGLSYLIIKKLRPLIADYGKEVVASFPVQSWVINLVLISYYFVRAVFHYQMWQISIPVYFAITIVYGIATYLILKIATNYCHYQQLATSQAHELENLRVYTSHIEALYDDLRRFRHDYKNLLLSLESAVKDQDMKAVTKIFNQTIEPTKQNTEDRTSVLGRLAPVQSLAVKSLLYQKIMTAINDGIEVNVEIEHPIQPSTVMKSADLLRVISILLDNAIQAATKAHQPKIDLAYFDDPKRHAQILIVGNSTKEEQVNLSNLAKHPQFSWRASKHGIGLRNLRQIIAQYPAVQNNRRSANHWFEQEIVIHQA